MERTLEDRALDFYLTFDPHRLPEYGDTVVAVVLGDEVGFIPPYLDRVRAVFKCYGTRPALGAGLLRNPSLTGVAALAQYTVRWLRWLPSAAGHSRLVASRTMRGERPPPALSVVPLGTWNQLELPIVPIENRPTDMFFAGSVEHRASQGHRLLSAKVRARREMLAALERLAGLRPGLRIDVRITSDFKASEASSSVDYSHAMMAARACLAPRGTSVETYRLLEGLRYGCVVVSEPLPPHWFYKGAPFIRVDRWRDLDSALMPVLDDDAALRRLHASGLAWWRDRCSEAVVGRFIADRLN